MPKSGTGSICTASATRLELKFLLENGYIKLGCHITGSINWNRNGEPSGSIRYESKLTEEEQYIRVYYTHTNSYTGEKKDYDYQIYLDEVPTNIGNGKRYYFICPMSGRRATILYMAYNSPIFKHRPTGTGSIMNSRCRAKNTGQSVPTLS